jgi:putative alpha-1,2-mannosidase
MPLRLNRRLLPVAILLYIPISKNSLMAMRYAVAIVVGLLLQLALPAQDVLAYVNPMIGTARSDFYTKWGNEGGTYPGAVAPWGYLQMTPETKIGGGYDFVDSTIGWFSCVSHHSGYPSGSAGEIKILPVSATDSLTAGQLVMARSFLHRDEEAHPGYYRVSFRDDGTLVEATASTHTGWLRCTFPPGVRPRLFIGGMGKITRPADREMEGEMPATAIQFDRDILDIQATGDGEVLSFAAVPGKATVLVVGVSVSAIGVGSAEKNLRKEAGGFDGVKERTQSEWRKQLSVITVEDDRVEAKTIFYTALYHSLLLPWIISDVEGHYRGRDGQIHTATGKNEYGGFSAWDTFRSLHPLLALLYPDRQQDMVLSMMDIYRETGYLPTDPMTGNHAIPVIVDSWMKGIRGFDPAEAYEAMRKGIDKAPYRPADRQVYQQLGYVPLSYPESVTRTVEYAYDDWALGWFAQQVLHREGLPTEGGAPGGDKGGYSYRNLFDPEELLMLPRDGRRFKEHPGTSGYKEGDAWVYTYFVPQHPKDLVNLLGGDAVFTGRLDSALKTQTIVFDNETVFHIPYLFNVAGHPGKTQEWVSRLRDGRFAVKPGGLPGNDDLGAFSSWYVFSALGFCPICPGRPEYELGTPLFRSVVLHLQNGRTFTIKAEGVSRSHPYIQSLAISGQRYTQLVLPHSMVMKGGEMVAKMSDHPGGFGVVRKEVGGPVFSFSGISVSKDRVASNELLQVRFTLHNQGSIGTKVVILSVNGRENTRKNCLVNEGGMVIDSIGCKLYPYGKAVLEIEGASVRTVVEVTGRGDGLAAGQLTGDLSTLAVRALSMRSLVKVGDSPSVSCLLQNVGGIARRYMVPIEVNDRVAGTDTLLLNPGEGRVAVFHLKAEEPGLQVIGVKGTMGMSKVYSEDSGTALLSLGLDSVGADGHTSDASGFGNKGKIVGEREDGIGAAAKEEDAVGKGAVGKVAKGEGLLLGKDCYVEVPNAPSLDEMGETITMMIRVLPATASRGLVDIFTKGDNHVLQIKDGKTLTFFAGGWGRGDCTVDLPDDWIGHWHHLAGVCTGHELRLYIDGRLAGKSTADGVVNLSVTNKWVLGRNEEFPGERIFHGRVRDARVYAAALTEEEIRALAVPHHQ